jgi:hypothetical protein
MNLLAKLIYETLFEDALLKEGGNAVFGVERINKEDIQPTINKIKKFIITPTFGNTVDIFLLGSTR